MNANGSSASTIGTGSTVYVWANFSDALLNIDVVSLYVNGILNQTNTTVSNNQLANFS